jgi:hypothetical protein
MSVENLKKMMAVAGVAAGFSLFAVSSANAAPDPNFHIYIAYGQSNMEGNATNFDKNVDGKEHPRVKMFATTSCSNLGRPTVGEMYPAVPPMFKCNAGLSPADWFGRHMADSLPDVTIGIIPVAQGGTSIRLFDPDDYKNYLNSAESWLKNGAKAYGDDGNAMGRIIEVAKKAQEKGVIKGIIFHQGETDGGMSNWEQIVKKTYEYMLKQLGLNAEETPFVAGEMVDGGSCAGFNSRVHNLSKYIVNFSYASSKGYGSKGDGLHFTVEGYRGMGQRYAQEMLKLINVAPVDPVPQEPFKGSAIAIPGKVEVEDFDKPGIGKNEDGTSNASYSDEDSENHGDTDYRKDTGVDLYKTADGIALGYTQAGEWLEYTVDVKADGEYNIDASVAAGNSTSAFKLYIDEKAITDDISVPQTADNSWDTYKTIPVKEKVALKAGKHVLKLEITANYANIDWISFSEPKKEDPPSAIAKVRFDVTDAESNFSVFDMQGIKLGSFTAKGMADAVNLVKTDAKLRKQSQGVFFVRKNGANRMTKKVVVYE